MVYIAEAHPGSIVALPQPDGSRELEIIPPTVSPEERLTNLRKLIQFTGLTIPAGIDGQDDVARNAYAGWPDRIYVIGTDGRIAYKGGPGPMGFKVVELAAWLKANVR